MKTKLSIESMYGSLAAPEDASVMLGGALPAYEDAAEGKPDSGLMWEYLNKGTLNGVPVAAADVGLKIDDEDTFTSVFRLHRSPKTLLLYLSPDDEQSLKKYNEVLERIYAGKAMAVDEQKEFDPAHGRFVVMLRYDEICYELDPRYHYLREE